MHAERLAAQGLTERADPTPVAVAERLLAVQGQDPRGFRLAVRARTRGLSAADVDAALTRDRSLVVDWLNRGTLHLVRAEDHGWLHALTTPATRAGNQRRLAREGVSPAAAERGVRVVCDALAADGPLPRGALRERLDVAGVPTAGQALVHVLILASLRGHIVRGPMAGADQAFVLVRDWLGEPARVDRDRALAELARRYLRGHGPATDRDLARWAGLGLRDVRAGLRAIASELVERPDGLLDLASRAAEAAPAVPGPRLLGAFDPVLLGWASRAWVTGPLEGVVTTNGIFRPFVLVDGVGSGVWRIERGRVVLGDGERATLAAEVVDVERYLGRS